MKLGLGVNGLAVASNINYFLLFLTLRLYCQKTSNATVQKVWVPLSCDAFEGWAEIIEVGGPGVAVYFIDWVCIYSLSFFSGFINVAQLTAMSCVLIIQPLVCSFGYALQLASTV